MSDDADRRRGLSRLRGLGRASTSIWSTEYQMRVALQGVEHWDRLTPEEQERFKTLMRLGGRDPSVALTDAEHKELRVLWKRLGTRELMREAVRLARGAVVA
jgi:hypothetical protein